MDTDSPAQSRTSVTPAWLVWVRALLLIATMGAGYLAWVSFYNGPVAGCGPESACNKVLQSRWAYWLDFPVSLPAVLVYLALMGATFLLQKRPEPDDQRGSWVAIISLSVIVAGAALWFVGLQAFVIKAFCKFCMTAHACGFTAALICLRNIPWAEDPTTPMWSSGSGKRGVPRSAILPLITIGLAGVVVLAGGQLLFQKERNVVKVLKPAANPVINTSPPTQESNSTDYWAQAVQQLSQSASQKPTPNPRRMATNLLSLYGDEFALNLDELPTIGSPGASNIIVYLFDYTCAHCRQLHPILVETQRRYGDQLAIVCLPTPLSALCNPFLPARARSVPNACEYAQLSLAVWRADRQSWRQFDDWLFNSEKPPPVQEVRDYAAQLVGTIGLESALVDPWIQQQIKTDSRLLHTNSRVFDSVAMPQLIMGDAVSSGPLNSVQHLQLLLGRYLGLNPGQ